MRYADAPTTENALHIAAPPERVWPFVRDIALMAELSTELQEAVWIEPEGGPGSADPPVGARFRGHNAHPRAGEWETVSSVIECEPLRTFAWAVMDPANPTATWRFTLTPADGGTELRQWVQLGPGPSNLTPVIEKMPDKEEKIVGNRLAEFRAGIDRNLATIKERAEGGTAP